MVGGDRFGVEAFSVGDLRRYGIEIKPQDMSEPECRLQTGRGPAMLIIADCGERDARPLGKHGKGHLARP